MKNVNYTINESKIHSSFFIYLVASGSKLSLKLKHKILFKILNDNSKYNFKRSVPNPFKSFKSLIYFSFLISATPSTDSAGI